ncbi:hypothetical protein GF314_09965 [bacterium]|nr:hypothetical protein [bacterium]
MAKLTRQYSIMEVKKILEASEGMGPGKDGGHAIRQHGHLRADPTSRKKPHDSAFAHEIRIFGKRLVTPGAAGESATKVPPMDQAMVVAFALNSPKGQQKLRQLDSKTGKGPHGATIVTDMDAIAHKLPQLRIGQGDNASTGTLPRIHVELFKIDDRLHIHTAYARA